MRPRRVFEHLAAEAHIARYASHAERLLHLQRRFETALPPRLRQYARVANLRAGKLVIHVSSAAAAAKIRQLLPRLTQDFLGDSSNVTEIEVKVQATAGGLGSAGITQRPPLPSADRCAELQSLQQGLEDSSPIKHALGRLLKTLKEQ